jgi:RNA polymerase sigma-70 factor (ECF subfamily)
VSINTQASLLARIQDAEDPMAWEQFWSNYGPVIYQFAKYRGCSDETAQDLAQDVMLEVFEKNAVFRYDRSKGRFRDWLGGMVRNLTCKRRAKPAERVRGTGGDGDPRIAEAAQPSDDERWDEMYDQAVLAALLDVVRQEVAPATYQAFEMVAVQGISGKLAAKATGLSRNAVYQARKRIIRRLRELGESYRDQGQLLDRVKRVLESRPPVEVERAMTTKVEETMRRVRGAGE